MAWLRPTGGLQHRHVCHDEHKPAMTRSALEDAPVAISCMTARNSAGCWCVLNTSHLISPSASTQTYLYLPRPPCCAVAPDCG